MVDVDYKVRLASDEEVKKYIKHDDRLYLSARSINFALDIADSPVSFLSCDIRQKGKVLYVTTVYTIPEQRNHGYGSILFRCVEGMVHKSHPSVIKVKLRALSRSVPFYERMGFTPIKYLDLKLGSVVDMEKNLQI